MRKLLFLSLLPAQLFAQDTVRVDSPLVPGTFIPVDLAPMAKPPAYLRDPELATAREAWYWCAGAWYSEADYHAGADTLDPSLSLLFFPPGFEAKLLRLDMEAFSFLRIGQLAECDSLITHCPERLVGRMGGYINLYMGKGWAFPPGVLINRDFVRRRLAWAIKASMK